MSVNGRKRVEGMKNLQDLRATTILLSEYVGTLRVKPAVFKYGNLYVTLSWGNGGPTGYAQIWKSPRSSSSFTKKIDLVDKVPVLEDRKVCLTKLLVTKEGSWLVRALDKDTLEIWILRSEDGGASWSQVYNRTFDEAYNIHELTQDRYRNTHENIYSSMSLNGTQHLLKSNDDGKTWSEIDTGISAPDPTSYNIHAFHDVVLWGTRDDLLVYSTDGGSTFNSRTFAHNVFEPLYVDEWGRWLVSSKLGSLYINNTLDLSGEWYEVIYPYEVHNTRNLMRTGDKLLVGTASYDNPSVLASPDMLRWQNIFTPLPEGEPFSLVSNPICRIAAFANRCFVGGDRAGVLFSQKIPPNLQNLKAARVVLWDDESIAGGDSTPFIPVKGKGMTFKVLSDTAGTATIEVQDPGGAWKSYDSFPVDANSIETYTLTGSVEKVRVSFDTAATITVWALAEIST